MTDQQGIRMNRTFGCRSKLADEHLNIHLWAPRKRLKLIMQSKSKTKCPYAGKVFLLPDGKVVESRCCKSPYCKRCCWYRKWQIHQKAPHRSVVLCCFQTYLVLPYYKPIPRATKKTVNEYFWRGLRKKSGPLAYIHSLEEQGGLLHGNWHLLTDKRVEKEYVFARWGEALSRHAQITFKEQHGYCEPIEKPEQVTEYVLKYYEKDPATYLPERGRYRKVMYPSQNYNEYVLARSADTLIAQMFDNSTALPDASPPPKPQA